MRRHGAVGPDSYRQLRQDLGEILRPEQLAGVEVRGLRSGVLTLGVRSAPLKHELEAFYNDKMLGFLQRDKGRLDVRQIRFRLTS